MKIAVDAMGGDSGPKIIVPGAAQAAEDYGLDIVLVGLEPAIAREIRKLSGSNPRISVAHAPEDIAMGEGLLSFRKKKESSITVGTRLVRDGQADAFVSMGNTAAVVYISRSVLGSLRGVDRPALALLLPNVKGGLNLLIDVGANANCRPRNLLQFAAMGKIFMEAVVGTQNPRIGLMSIGEERGKGNDLVKETFEWLQNSSMNFIGNVEGKDIFSTAADVIVSDGFTGNIALKASEGVVESMLSLAKHEITRNIFAKVGYLLMRRHLKKIYKMVDYSEYGGAQLLGVDGVCIIGHGRSNPAAVKNAILRARDFVANRVQEKIQLEIARQELGLKEAET